MALPAGVVQLGAFKGRKGDKGETGVLAFMTAEKVPWTEAPDVEMVGPEGMRGAHIKVPVPLPTPEAVNNDVATQGLLLNPTQTQAATHQLIVNGVSATPKFLDGSRLLIVGDSISWQGTLGAQGSIWWSRVEYSSQGRLHLFASTAVSGNSSRQQRDAVRAFIAAGGTMPTMATVLVGANNLSGDEVAQFPGWQQDIVDIVSDLRAVGCEPVLCTVTPRSGPATSQPASVVNGKWNAWLRRWAFERGVIVCDMWRAVADPITGQWRTNYADPADGVHPFPLAHQAMAQELAQTVLPLLIPTPQIPKTRRLSDGNLLPSGIITSAAAPAGWLAPDGVGHTYEIDSDAPGGFAAQINAVDPAVVPQFRPRTLASEGTWLPGDKITVFLKWRIEQAVDVGVGRGIRALLLQYNGGTQVRQNEFLYGQRIATDDYQMVTFDTTIEANATELRLHFQYSKGNSPATNRMVARLGAVGIYNRSRGVWIA